MIDSKYHPLLRVRRVARRLAAGLLGLVVAVVPAGAQPSATINGYVLFAQEGLNARTLTVNDGDVGVNAGVLYLRGTIAAPQSDFVADEAHMDGATDCGALFTNRLIGSPASCPHSPGAVSPLIADLAAACGMPSPFPACNPAKPVLVDHGQVTSLPPGTYGDLLVQGGGAGPAFLRLGGDYTFCNVRVSRNAGVLFDAPSTVRIVGNSTVSNAAFLGPDPGLGAGAPSPGTIQWLVQGSSARFSRKGMIALEICAPNAKMVFGSGMSLTGRFVARAIRMKRTTVVFVPPSSPTTTTTTTAPSTTTTLPSCTDDEDCNPGSPNGGFVCEDGHCVPGCEDDEDCEASSPGGGFVCEDGHCVPPSSTTTTTTGPATTTTSTTLPPECTTDADCNEGSPGGGFVCDDGHCVPGGEVCGDCQDNDGDGLVDFEDADCCAAEANRLFAMDLRKGRVVPRGNGRSRLRLKGVLARSGMATAIDPPHQQVAVQIRSADGQVLCAQIPAGMFTKKRKAFRFSRKKTPLPVEIGRDLDRMRVKRGKHGSVRFRLRAKQAQLETPPQGPLTITIGFATPGTAAADNVCSQAVRAFRSAKKARLTYP